ncbi:hypothetical protein [Mycobacteroides abscessus]|uniref:hypothetical protein n=1 Tax=Mycobacteroides abscessus TaxID=36809 RepID=UPI0006982E3E
MLIAAIVTIALAGLLAALSAAAFLRAAAAAPAGDAPARAAVTPQGATVFARTAHPCARDPDMSNL